MTSIDPRLADRRKEVAEDRARRNVRRALRVIVALAVIGAIVWLFLSPTLSVSSLEVTGVNESGTIQLLEDADLVLGRPLVLIRSSEVEETLLTDPWVRSADVDVKWPNRVTVDVAERLPIAWAETGGGWARRAVDGVELPGGDEPDDTMARVVLPGVADQEVADSTMLLGALEFVASLPPSIGRDVEIEERDGELWASIGGHEVRLGRPAEMEAKARTLTALLGEELAPGSQINLLAPTNPAVEPPTTLPAP